MSDFGHPIRCNCGCARRNLAGKEQDCPQPWNKWVSEIGHEFRNANRRGFWLAERGFHLARRAGFSFGSPSGVFIWLAERGFHLARRAGFSFGSPSGLHWLAERGRKP